MSLRLTILVSTALLLPACATVDITDMASSTTMVETSEPVEKNVVIRATRALKATFKDNGWSKDNTQSVTMQKAAMVLLQGSNAAKTKEAAPDSRPDQMPEIVQIRADLVEAGKSVAQAVRAAEIYLDVSETDEDLRKELKALEKALLLSRKAETRFESLCETSGLGTSISELETYSTVVDQLRDSANLYGEHVRQHSRKVTAPAS